MFNMSSDVYGTYYNSYINFLVKYLTNLPLDLLSISRYCMFLDIFYFTR